MSGYLCSVVIPSYNRRPTLEMVLQGLASQSIDPTRFQVIVVLDGGTDDSPAMLEAWRQSGRLPALRWERQRNSGQAAARSRGVELAEAPVILFLDDDVVPEPELLAVHLAWHERDIPLAVLGDCQIVREASASLYQLGVWAWWEEMYHRRALPGRQPGYRDFCAGNVSLRRQDFLRVGGFDSSFRGYGGEDFELGHRLLRAGVRFVADRRARARHYHRTDVAGVLRATRQEAHGDVRLGQKHPELRAGLRLATLPEGRYRMLVALALRAPALGDLLVAVGRWLLSLLERLKMRRKWCLLFDHLRGYAYWRGVRDALGSWAALLAYQAGALPVPEQRLDITHGLPDPLPPLFVDGPSRLLITFQGRALGTLDLQRHIDGPVRSYLADEIMNQLGGSLWVQLAAARASLPDLATSHREADLGSNGSPAG